jgi:phospholipase/lecithinase/hemolysin
MIHICEYGVGGTVTSWHITQVRCFFARAFRRIAIGTVHVNTYADVYRGIHPSPGPGGLNYAEGGARVAQAYSHVSDDPEGALISAVVQFQHFLAQHGSFAADQIAMLNIGTNEVAYDYDPTIDPTLAAALRAGRYPDRATLRAQESRVQAAADAEIPARPRVPAQDRRLFARHRDGNPLRVSSGRVRLPICLPCEA